MMSAQLVPTNQCRNHILVLSQSISKSPMPLFISAQSLVNSGYAHSMLMIEKIRITMPSVNASTSNTRETRTVLRWFRMHPKNRNKSAIIHQRPSVTQRTFPSEYASRILPPTIPMIAKMKDPTRRGIQQQQVDSIFLKYCNKIRYKLKY